MLPETWEKETPETFGVYHREVSKSNYRSILYFSVAGIPFCLFDMSAQYLMGATAAFFLDLFLLVYYAVVFAAAHLVIPEGYRHSTRLLYWLQAIPLLIVTLNGTLLAPERPVMTVFVFLSVLPVMIFDRRIRVNLWTLFWTVLFAGLARISVPPEMYGTTLLYAAEFCLASLTVSNTVNLWREDRLKNYLEALARNYDVLTGLPNYYQFMNTAEEEAGKYFSRGQHPALIYYNIVNLKAYNAKFGYQEGSELLKRVAGYIRDAFPDALAARIGQDHFAVLTDMDAAGEALRIVDARVKSPDGEGDNVQIRAGVYLLKKDEEIGTACDRAKTAADSIRTTPGACFRLYDEEFRKKVEERQYILENVDRAVKEGWIETWYQPVVRAATGELCSEEALVRWNDPVIGRIPPDEFVPILEENRLIYKVDLCNAANILRDIRDRQKQGMFLNPVSLNLSRTDFTQMDMPAELAAMADRAGIDRKYLIIEITESAFAAREKFLQEIIARFHGMGFKVWIDDFGSGYSALNLLAGCGFDLLKFDAAFTKGLTKGSPNEIILTSIVDMAHKLGIETLAEGVETEEQYEILKTIGCSKLQGFYFSTPNPQFSVLKKFHTGTIRSLENPQETEYLEKISRINLNEPVRAEKNALPELLHIVPSVVIEMDDGDRLRILRANREYMQYFADQGEKAVRSEKGDVTFRPDSGFMKLCREAVSSGRWATNSEILQTDEKVPTFVKYLGKNPVTGRKALVAAVLYEGLSSEQKEKKDKNA